MIRSGLANIDAQAKLALSMRTTVESIQTLTWAGELAGVSMVGTRLRANLLWPLCLTLARVRTHKFA